jgi:DNA (cytosine-5)-methyltransferase 1
VTQHIRECRVVKGGSLFSGVRGLDAGIDAAVGGETAWCVEYDSAPSAVLEYHWPQIPNYGDVTRVRWGDLEPVDYLSGGYPCQPFSMIGKRKGKDDERHLWPYYAAAIRELRPRFAILENVAGHLSLGFDSVLRDLAEIGWDAEWLCLPASDAGAPHRRERVFILAYPADQPWRIGDGADLQARRGAGGRRSTSGAGAVADPDDLGSDGRWGSRHGGLEPSYDRVPDAVWGRHLSAIKRWETIVGRHAPWPGHLGGGVTTEFTEWQMGWPYGLVTDPAIGLSREQQAHIIGNGVVPQQARLAVSDLADRLSLNDLPKETR